MSLKEENSESAVSMITKLGLTNLQAKAYIGLVQLGGGSASEVAKAANINRAEIYRIMRELQKHEIVACSISAPKKFIPVQSKKAVNRLLEKMKKEVHEIENEKNNLINWLNTTKTKITREKNLFYSILKDKKIIHGKVFELIKNAKSDLAVIIRSGTSLGRIISLRGMLDQNAGRVKIRVIMNVTPEKLPEIEKFDNSVEIRHKETSFFMTIADNNGMCVGFELGAKTDKNVSSEVITLCSNDESLIEASGAKYFNLLWSDSIPLKDRVQQLKKRGKAINRVKNHCGYCGEKMPAEYNYCPKCGKKL